MASSVWFPFVSDLKKKKKKKTSTRRITFSTRCRSGQLANCEIAWKTRWKMMRKFRWICVPWRMEPVEKIAAQCSALMLWCIGLLPRCIHAEHIRMGGVIHKLIAYALSAMCRWVRVPTTQPYRIMQYCACYKFFKRRLHSPIGCFWCIS